MLIEMQTKFSKNVPVMKVTELCSTSFGCRLWHLILHRMIVNASESMPIMAVKRPTRRIDPMPSIKLTVSYLRNSKF